MQRTNAAVQVNIGPSYVSPLRSSSPIDRAHLPPSLAASPTRRRRTSRRRSPSRRTRRSGRTTSTSPRPSACPRESLPTALRGLPPSARPSPLDRSPRASSFGLEDLRRLSTYVVASLFLPFTSLTLLFPSSRSLSPPLAPFPSRSLFPLREASLRLPPPSPLLVPPPLLLVLDGQLLPRRRGLLLPHHHLSQRSRSTRRESLDCGPSKAGARADHSPRSCRLFNFETDQPGEISLVKDELVEVAQKDEAGESPYSARSLLSLLTLSLLRRLVVGQEGRDRGMGSLERESFALRRLRTLADLSPRRTVPPTRPSLRQTQACTGTPRSSRSSCYSLRPLRSFGAFRTSIVAQGRLEFGSRLCHARHGQRRRSRCHPRCQARKGRGGGEWRLAAELEWRYAGGKSPRIGTRYVGTRSRPSLSLD